MTPHPLPRNIGRILIIKLGALGDFIQALGPMQAARETWKDAHITLLTTKPFQSLGQASGIFDEILIDTRPPLFDVGGILKLRKLLRDDAADLVIDLQTSDRSGAYQRLYWPRRPLWSGIAPGASHPHDNKDRDRMHTVDRQREQLARLGIETVKPSDLSFLAGDLSADLELPGRFALLVPGGAPHRPEKRWPGPLFGELGLKLLKQGLTPVILGTQAEAKAADEILETCPQAHSLIGKTSLMEIATIAGKASIAIGNDTGPMHLITSMNCPSLVLYSNASDPALCGQRGNSVAYLREANLANLSVDTALEALKALPKSPIS